MAEESRAVSVAFGQEIIATDDGCSMSFFSEQNGGGVGVPMMEALPVDSVTPASKSLVQIGGLDGS